MNSFSILSMEKPNPEKILRCFCIRLEKLVYLKSVIFVSINKTRLYSFKAQLSVLTLKVNIHSFTHFVIFNNDFVRTPKNVLYVYLVQCNCCFASIFLR